MITYWFVFISLYYLSEFGLNESLCTGLENADDFDNTFTPPFLTSIIKISPSSVPIAKIFDKFGLQHIAFKPASFFRIPNK